MDLGGLDTDTLARVAAYAPDPIVVMDGLGRIVWVNDVADRTFPAPGTSMVGSFALDWIHPDDHGQAFTAITANATISEERSGQAVLAAAPYRLLLPDGTHRWYEVAGQPHPDLADGQLTVAILRDVSRQQRVTRAIELIAESSDIESVLEELLHGMESTEPRRAAGVSWTSEGRRRVAAISLPPELVWTDDPEDPWVRATATGTTVGVSIDDLRPELRALAEGCELVTCAAVPVVDPGSNEPACLVLWADHVAVVDSLQLRAHLQAHSLLQLALAQRHERHQLLQAASHDPLTGLLNRRELLRRLHTLQEEGVPVSLLFCDLDEFKPLNDRHGHEVGDRALRIVADRLAAAMRDGDIVGRIGGDEFAIVVIGATDPEQVVAVADRVLATVSQPLALEIEGRVEVVKIGISVGIASSDPPVPCSADVLLAVADDAMYTAKRSGRGRWHLSIVPSAGG